MEFAVAAFLLALVVGLVVARPLLRGPEVDRREDERRATLEAAKEAKYREIRDAELDHRMGKLTEADFRTTDRELRAQAIAILRELDALTPEDSGGDPAGDAAGASSPGTRSALSGESPRLPPTAQGSGGS